MSEALESHFLASIFFGTGAQWKQGISSKIDFTCGFVCGLI